MRYLDSNPVGQIIQPIGLYNDFETFRSLLTFAQKNEENGKWGFKESFDGMSLEDIYYVFSPSITPIPPYTNLYQTLVTEKSPYDTKSITLILDDFDIKEILRKQENTNKLLNIIFCSYTRSFPDTIPLYIFIHKEPKTLNYNIYISKTNKFPNESFNKFYRDIYQQNKIYVMKNIPKGFEKSRLNICIPSNKVSQNISECIYSLDTYNQNINRLWQTSIDDDLAIKEKNSSNVNSIIIISTTLGIVFLIIFILIFLNK